MSGHPFTMVPELKGDKNITTVSDVVLSGCPINPAGLHNLIQLIRRVQVRQVASVQDIIDILHLLLVDDLSIYKQKRNWLVIEPRGQQSNLDVFTPLHHPVSL